MFREEMRKRGFVFLSGEPGVMPTLHRHREVEVNLVVQGEMVYLFGGSRAVLSAGQIAVFWATIPHQVVRLVPGTRYYCVHLPLARFLQWQISREFTSRLLHGEIVCEQDPSRIAHDPLLFQQWHHDLERDASDVNHVVLLELEARLRRLVWGMGQSAEERIGELPASLAKDPSFVKIEQMTIYLTEHYQERITMTDIAAAANLHPKYAMSLFRARCGMTLGEYLVQQRLSQAQRLLATTEEKVVDIAFSSGFGSVSQFYEMFTRFCGQSPKDFRISQK